MISECGADEVEAALPDMQGGMRPKLQACVEAIHGGVTYAHIIDGRAAALAAARAVHGRRHRHEGEARVMSLAPTYARYPVEFASGSGCVLRDSEGNEYLDFLAGIAVNNVGHCHPRVVEAIREQAGRLIHVSNLFYTARERVAGRRGWSSARSAATCSSATPARRPTRPR